MIYSPVPLRVDSLRIGGDIFFASSQELRVAYKDFGDWKNGKKVFFGQSI
jgi:hypothetical protein